ncbi:MAG: hypothetical protein V3U65_18265 [Granulosicoccaceae bacterium]
MAFDTEPVEYIRRTRRYYQALGYGKPYDWAHFDSVPFTLPTKPVSKCTVGIVSTAAPYQPDKGDQSPGAPYNATAKFFSVYRLPVNPKPDLRISHIAIDRDHTTAEDPASYLPIVALEAARQHGRIGDMAKHVFGLPTNRSQSQTIKIDCQELLKFVKEDDINIIVFVPNCPVCHQSVSLAARTLEEAGVLTVILGCAKDIIEHVGVPRFLFSDFPLGNAAGIPGDVHCQQGLINAALDLVETAKAPRTTVQSPYVWPGTKQWKADYSNPDHLSKEEIRRKRAAFDLAKA